MSDDTILTEHPEGKRGVNISKAKYDAVKMSILECLGGRELAYTDLVKCVGEKLEGRFEGSIPWYVEVVKLDLEARGTIERVPATKPELYRLRSLE